MLSSINFAALISLIAINAVLATDCPTFSTQMPFDVKRYLGTWFEIYRTSMIFQDGNRCVNATYTDNGDGTIGVWNQAINRDGSYSTIRGVAQPKTRLVPSALSVQFDNPAQQGDYNVLSTDYDNYALVYSCRFIPTINLKAEFAWFLSRTKSLPDDVNNRFRSILAGIGANINTLAQTPQNC